MQFSLTVLRTTFTARLLSRRVQVFNHQNDAKYFPYVRFQQEWVRLFRAEVIKLNENKFWKGSVKRRFMFGSWEVEFQSNVHIPVLFFFVRGCERTVKDGKWPSDHFIRYSRSSLLSYSNSTKFDQWTLFDLSSLAAVQLIQFELPQNLDHELLCTIWFFYICCSRHSNESASLKIQRVNRAGASIATQLNVESIEFSSECFVLQ